jgi:hypothetical protein
MKLPLIICVAAFAVCAASAQAGTQVVSQTSTGLVTPDIATAHKMFLHHLLTVDGDLVVCPVGDWYTYREGTCKDPAGKNRWLRVIDVVPKGKTYAGYSIDMYRQNIYVFWR